MTDPGAMDSYGQPPAISLRGIVKRYREITAIDGLDLDVPERTCAGLLGPNGASKSTQMKTRTAQVIPEEGEASVLGYTLPGESNQARSDHITGRSAAACRQSRARWRTLGLARRDLSLGS